MVWVGGRVGTGGLREKGVQDSTTPGTGEGWESAWLPLLDYLLSTLLL